MVPSFVRPLLCCLLCLGPSLPVGLAQSSTNKLPEEVVASIRLQVGLDDARPTEKNPAGLHISFQKIGENTTEQGHSSVYRAYAVGAPEKQKYAMVMWRVGSSPQLMPGDVYVNAKGLLMAHKPRPGQENQTTVDEDDEVDFAVQTARGEPVRFVLTTPGEKFAIPGTVVPYPIRSEDRGCQLEARLALPSAAAVIFYVDGFAPNSDIAFHSSSEGEAHDGVFHTDARGHGVTITLPYVAGKDAGVLKFSVSTKECSTSVEVPWGKASYSPL